MILPASLRASASDMALALPMEYQRDPRPWIVYTHFQARWPDGCTAQRQAVLEGVPVHDDPVGVGPHGPDEGVRQPPLVRLTARGGAVSSGSWHVPINPG